MEALIVPARLEHAFVLATTLRHADVAELEVCGYRPLDALLQSLRFSACAWAVLYDDEVGALFGVVEPRDTLVLGREDQLWFLTGHVFGRHPKAFIRALKRALAAVLERYPVLTNVIDARYTGAQRLAQSFGAVLEPARPFGLNGELFVPFRIVGF